MTFDRLSLKIGFISILLMAMFLMTTYKATMNAFLAIRQTKFPINSFEDVLESKENILVWKGSRWEEQYKLAPKGSLFKRIYLEKIKDQPSLTEVGGFEGALEIVARGEAIYSGSLAGVYQTKFHPCHVTAIPNLMLVVYLVMHLLPIKKNITFDIAQDRL